MELAYFCRTPPGLQGDIVPTHQDRLGGISARAQALYANRPFICTVPTAALPAWEQSGQLRSYLGTLVHLDWINYSVEHWAIAPELDLTTALVRETYPISPQALGFKDYNATPAQKAIYDRAFQEMLESVRLLSSTPDYRNPEVLLPGTVPAAILRKVGVIE